MHLSLARAAVARLIELEKSAASREAKHLYAQVEKNLHVPLTTYALVNNQGKGNNFVDSLTEIEKKNREIVTRAVENHAAYHALPTAQKEKLVNEVTLRHKGKHFANYVAALREGTTLTTPSHIGSPGTMPDNLYDDVATGYTEPATWNNFQHANDDLWRALKNDKAFGTPKEFAAKIGLATKHNQQRLDLVMPDGADAGHKAFKKKVTAQALADHEAEFAALYKDDPTIVKFTQRRTAGGAGRQKAVPVNPANPAAQSTAGAAQTTAPGSTGSTPPPNPAAQPPTGTGSANGPVKPQASPLNPRRGPTPVPPTYTPEEVLAHLNRNKWRYAGGAAAASLAGLGLHYYSQAQHENDLQAVRDAAKTASIAYTAGYNFALSRLMQ